MSICIYIFIYGEPHGELLHAQHITEIHLVVSENSVKTGMVQFVCPTHQKMENRKKIFLF